MTAALWLIPALLLSSGGTGSTDGKGCQKTCEKRYVPCKDGRADQQMMCFEVERRCEIRCEPTATAPKAKARRMSLRK